MFTSRNDGSYKENACIAPGLRLGWIVANPTIIEKLVVAKQASDLHSNVLAQKMICEFIKGDHYELTGLLTMKGIGNEVKLDVEFNGLNKDPWGNQKAGFSISGKISRKDWGLNWNAALETGGVLVSDEVKISGEVQFIRKSDDY